MGSPRLGIDIVSVARIARSLGTFGEKFVNRYFTFSEVLYCRGCRQVERMAGRIAAKEAVMKVLGRGWPGISWTDIEILPDASGRPVPRLSGRALEAMMELGFLAIDVSITHDGGIAVAVALGIPGTSKGG